jgi:hypothetical protein
MTPDHRSRTPDSGTHMNSETEKGERELEPDSGVGSMAERSALDLDAESFELSSRRTGLSFQRTRIL